MVFFIKYIIIPAHFISNEIILIVPGTGVFGDPFMLFIYVDNE